MARKNAKTRLLLVPERVSERYLSIDPRTLGAARIYIGGLLLAELAQRAGSWFALYADDGVFGRAQQGSLADRSARRSSGSSARHLELTVLFALLTLVYLALLLGFWTRLANVLAFIAWTSISRRLPIATNSGYVVMSLVLLWTSLLPMGKRFSLDGLRASLARHPEIRVADLADRDAIGPDKDTLSSLTALAVILQISAIYFFNAAMKYGEPWKDLTAVHYVLHDNEFTAPLAGLIRDHLPAWLYKGLAAGTLGLEYGIAVSVLLPFAWTRRVAYASIAALHLGFGVMMLLGPFSWACCGFAALLVPPEDWELVGKTLRRKHRARTVIVDEDDARAMRFARLLARLDAFRLLGFERGERGAGFSVRDAGGRVATGRAAVAACIAALPLGPIVAPLLATPLGDVTPALAAGLVRLLRASRRRRAREGGPRSPASRSRSMEVSTAALIVIGTAQTLCRTSTSSSDATTTSGRRSWSRSRRPSGWSRAGSSSRPAPTERTRFTVVDAETRDGRHIDPFTGRPPLTTFDEPLASYGLVAILGRLPPQAVRDRAPTTSRCARSSFATESGPASARTRSSALRRTSSSKTIRPSVKPSPRRRCST